MVTILGSHASAAGPSRKLIIDCDPGIDDAIAMVMALQHPGFDILGITTTFGNATTEKTTRNALRIVELSGKNISVCRGATQPVSVPLRPPPDFVHGEDGLGNTRQPEPVLRTQNTPAAQFLIDAARRHRSEVTILALGPLSNLAEALKLDSSFARNVREVVLMGGALYVPGNVSPVAEANIYGDPHAADLVFTTPWKVTMIGLDVTTKVRLSDEILSRVKTQNETFGPFVWSISRFYAEFHRRERVPDGVYAHDPSAVLYLVEPEIFGTRQGSVRVVCEGIAIGQTIMAAYDHQFQLAPWRNQPLVTAAVAVNPLRFQKALEQLMVGGFGYNPGSAEETAVASPIPSQPNQPAEQSASAAAAQLFASYYEERLKLFPLEATLAGDHRYDGQLPNDLTESFRAAEQNFFRRYLQAVQGLDRERLSEEERLSCDILRWQCETALDSLSFPTHLMPINQFNSLHLRIGQWAGGTGAQPFNTVQDYDNWLKRLETFSEWCHTAVTKMREGIKAGWVLPKALIQKTLPQMAAMAQLPAENHLYYSPIRKMPDTFSAGDRARLAQAYAMTIEEKIVPAFHELEVFLTREYLPAGRDSSGISGIPQGTEFYRSQVKRFTTTSLSPEEIFDLGQREVARIQGEMEKVKQSVGFKGDLRSFFDEVRSRKELMPFTNASQVLERFQAIRDKMSPSLTRLFHLKPKTPLDIRRTEAFREATASAEWVSGSLDGARPGIFYVPIPDVQKYNVFQDEALFLHEALPGHHYHLSLQRENAELPMFRRVLDLSTFNEGWALYCESLGKELGLYRDLYQYFGMLGMEMHRAIRLVVDPGLHAKGWTREQAIQYSLEHEADSEEAIVSEVERYMAWPGQALAYKIGQRKILELRTRAERALGAEFDVRDFHDSILESGAMPLPLLEGKVRRWIQQKRARTSNDPQPDHKE